MTDHRETIRQDQNLCLLRALEEAPGYRSNEGVLQAALSIYGHNVSRDKVSGLTSWLEEQGLITIEEIGSGVRIVTLTGRGQDVAAGLVSHPGVKRPRAR